MLPDYTYVRTAASKEELAAYFTQRLGLARLEAEKAIALRNEYWWVTIADPDEDWTEEADRLGLSVEQTVTVVFEPERGLSLEESFQAEVDMLTAIIDQLNETPGITGLLQHGDTTVLIERPAGGPTLLDARLADPEDYNHANHLAPVLSKGQITDLAQFD